MQLFLGCAGQSCADSALRCHTPATVSALPACGGAFLHTTKALAARGAFVANCRTFPTNSLVVGGTDEHKIGGRLAYLSTGRYQTKMSRSHVFAPDLQAVVHGCTEAHYVTFQTFVDAFPHFNRLVVQRCSPLFPGLSGASCRRDVLGIA